MKANAAKKSNLASDLVAGVVGGVANIPDGLASAILAGANPAYGLYAVMIGTPVGALLSSSIFMTIVNTSALSITTGTILAGVEARLLSSSAVYPDPAHWGRHAVGRPAAPGAPDSIHLPFRDDRFSHRHFCTGSTLPTERLYRLRQLLQQ